MSNRVDPSRWDQELRELGSTQVEDTEEGRDEAKDQGRSRWDQELSEMGSSRVEEAPHRVRFRNDAQHAIDTDEHDVEPNPMEAAGATENRPQARQERRRQERRRKRSNDSNLDVRNDAGDGHRPLHVESDIADLGTLLSLMQPQDISRAHEFGPTLEEYAVKGVPVDCGED